MRFRGLKWTIVGLCLWLSMAWSCKKRKIKTGNVPGSVLVLRPATARGRIVKKTLDLKLKLYDTEILAKLRVVFQKKQLWVKHFPPNKYSEHTVEKKIDLSEFEVKDGKDKVWFFLTDQAGVTSSSSLQIFVDRTGPSIAWLEPKPGEVLTQITKAELKIKDVSGVDTVKILQDNKEVKSFIEPPYTFALDPADYASGHVTFWIKAKDKLGNLSAKSVAFMVAGASLGTPCRFSDSCKSPFLCVKKKGAKRGFCRKRCRSNRQCPAGFECQKAGKGKFCVPPFYKTKKGKPVSGLFGRCSASRPCGPGLVCIDIKGSGKSCRIKCGGSRRCAPGFICRSVKYNEGSRKVKVCVKPVLVRTKGKFAKIGERCGPGKPCVKKAMCVKAGAKPAMCYKICRSNDDCSSVPCSPVPGKSRKVCVFVPRPYKIIRQAWAMCNNKRRCAKGLSCIGTRKGSMCYPNCGSNFCSSSTCATLAGRNLCLNKCNPNEPSCPTGTTCRFLPGKGSAAAYYCY